MNLRELLLQQIEHRIEELYQEIKTVVTYDQKKAALAAIHLNQRIKLELRGLLWHV